VPTTVPFDTGRPPRKGPSDRRLRLKDGRKLSARGGPLPAPC